MQALKDWDTTDIETMDSDSDVEEAIGLKCGS